MNINLRIKKLRDLMEDKGMDVYIVPTADPHQSEYVASHYKARAWISGFTGSAGLLIVSKDRAILWTDGRYFTQAEKQLEGSEIELYKMATPGYPTYVEWLAKNLGDSCTIGFDGRVLSQKEIESIEKEFGDREVHFEDNFDLVDMIWTDRPAIPSSQVFIHDERYSGYTGKEKIEKLKTIMAERDLDYHLISSLDDIAWLYNIRGRDVKNNPVSISYTLLGQDRAYLCIDETKLNDEVKKYLKDMGVELRAYDEIKEILQDIDGGKSILLDKSKVNRWLYTGIKDSVKIVDDRNITTNLKAIKNKTEIENQKNAYIKDGLAMTRLFYWIDKNKSSGKLNEVNVQEKLEELRRLDPKYIEPSFDTISAYGPNAAMMHYSASKDSYSNFEERGMYLLDAGGQYLDGTTDTTRTIALGDLTDEEKKDFTYTLKSHINLINARFLEGTTGYKLDGIARYPLWQIGSDYKCGTGHGVGFLLNVHEGPHRISFKYNDVALKEGMVVTIEPGVYKENKHGIRLENVVVVREDIETDSGKFLSFEVLSFVPLDLNCIDKKYLTLEEIEWLNSYHKQVYEKLEGYLNEEERSWLKEKTQEI